MNSIIKVVSVIALLLFGILIVSAQAVPLVDVVFDRETASQGDRVEASIFIRDGVNVAGADIGVSTNECLTLVERNYGSYLPDTSNGSFIPFDQQTDADTRLAVALTDRTQTADGDGVFYSLTLDVVCETGIGEVNVTFAELSSYVDPDAEQIELIAYRTDSNLMTQDGTIIIGEGAEEIVQATADAQAVEATTDADNQDDDGQQVEDTTNTTNNMFDSLTIVVMSVICCLILLLLLFIAYLVRRLLKDRQAKK